MFKKSMDYGQAGDNVGILLRGTKREEVLRGQVLAAPNTLKTYKKFQVCLMGSNGAVVISTAKIRLERQCVYLLASS